MKPEPMHAIEVVETPKRALPVPGAPPFLRVEIKCHPQSLDHRDAGKFSARLTL